MSKPRIPVVEILDPMTVQFLQNKTPAERLQQAFRMWEFAMSIMRASITRDNPLWSEDQIQQEICRRVRLRDRT
jgi:hypothetical protein